MKAVMDISTEQKTWILICATVIIFNIVLVYFALSYDDYFSAYDAIYVEMPAFILLMFGIIFFVWGISNFEIDYRYTIMSVVTLAICSATFVMVVISTPPLPYLKECDVLADETEFVSRNECMEYARYNPDATGAQIVDAVTEKNKVVPIEELLDRQLNP